MTRLTAYADELRATLEARLQPVTGGSMDGVLIVTARDILETWTGTPIPPPDEHMAELATPATVYLDARCHICGESGTVTVDLESKTTVDDKRRILAAKVDAGSVVHQCHQMTLPRPGAEPEQTEVWDIGDLTGPSAPDLRGAGLVDLLARVNVAMDPAVVDGWTEPEQRAAQQWAVAYHVWGVEGGAEPERPAHVPEPTEPTEEPYPEPEAEGPPSGKWLGGIDTTPTGPIDQPKRGRRPKATDDADR